MVSYRLDNNVAQPSTGLTRMAPQMQPTSINDHIVSNRPFINQQRHAVIIHDASGQIVFRNQTVLNRVSNQSMQHERPMDSHVWEAVCRAVTSMVNESLDSGDDEISGIFPVDQRAFVVVGSVLKQSSGMILGTVTNISEVRSDQLASRYSSPVAQGDNAMIQPSNFQHNPQLEAEFQEWLTKRDSARQKMEKLSKRETEVVALVALGMPNKSIARELDISVKTIEKHRANAVRKLGVCSTAEMVRIAVEANSSKSAGSTQM